MRGTPIVSTVTPSSTPSSRTVWVPPAAFFSQSRVHKTPQKLAREEYRHTEGAKREVDAPDVIEDEEMIDGDQDHRQSSQSIEAANHLGLEKHAKFAVDFLEACSGFRQHNTLLRQ
jgi:hypothetical protein